MLNITEISVEKNCAGCGACVASCSQNAIALQENQIGFYEAVVNEKRCIQCGKCMQVCPRNHGRQGTSLCGSTLFALQSCEPEVVHSSSSGGVAQELSRAFIAKDGKVIGAIYDFETHRVRHQIVADMEQLKLLSGSKYLQSDPTVAFAEAMCAARANPEERFLLFGTPCQVAGFAAAAERKGIRQQFILVELFCHGVPTYRLWDAAVQTISKKLGTPIWDEIQFRYKKAGWHSYCLRVDAGNRSYYGKRETMLFWQVFFEDILLNDACWKCQARKDTSAADIRLGDYWGRRFSKREDGVSAVFAMTDCGRTFVQELILQGRVRMFEAGTAEEVLLSQNMKGYSQMTLHENAMEQLRCGKSIKGVVRQYRRSFTAKQKAKLQLLKLSALLPDNLRVKIKKRLHR